MWVVIYLAKGKSTVDGIRDLLEKNDILVMVRKKTDESDDDLAFYEILVPQTELEAGQNLIIENIG